jgi:hypothetical protein
MSQTVVTSGPTVACTDCGCLAPILPYAIANNITTTSHLSLETDTCLSIHLGSILVPSLLPMQPRQRINTGETALRTGETSCFKPIEPGFVAA